MRQVKYRFYISEVTQVQEKKNVDKEWAQSCGYHISNKFDTFIVFHAKLKKKNKDKLQHCILELVFKNPMRFIPIFHECIIFDPVVQVPQ